MVSNSDPTVPFFTDTTVAANLAALEKCSNTSVVDLVYWDDMDPLADETTSDLQALEQDVYHILLEAMASNLDDPTHGVNITGALSGTLQGLQARAQMIDAQLEGDDRVNSSRTTVQQNSDGTYLVLMDIGTDGSVVRLKFTLQQASVGTVEVLP